MEPDSQLRSIINYHFKKLTIDTQIERLIHILGVLTPMIKLKEIQEA
jgi:hypothetical protein